MVTFLIALQVLDLLTTLYLLKRGGRELNPVLSRLQGIFGRDGAILAAKAGVVVLVLKVEIPMEMLVALAAFYVFIVIHNARQIKRTINGEADRL